jgi:nucleoside-diphosphate-sugar epimerase
MRGSGVRRLGASGPNSNARFKKAVQSILVRLPWVVLGSTKIAGQVPQIRFGASAAGHTGCENGGPRVISNSSKHCNHEEPEKPVDNNQLHSRKAQVPCGRPLIALTGATGFIGQHLLHELPKRGYRLRVLLRRPSVVPLESASAIIGDLARPQNMTAALADVDAVIHSAGLANAMSGLPEDDYRTLNTEATIALARAAQRAGARRFVFLSSIRAQCGSSSDHVLTEDLTPQPTDAYGRSKLAAEQGLAELALDWVALRLVLVYGAGMKGNMAELARLARTSYPLPLGALRSRRSLLSLDNLVAAVDAVLSAPGRLRRPLIVSDPEALTIPAIVAAMRRGLGRRPGLIPVPVAVLRTALQAAGRGEIYERLSGSLVAEPTGLRELGWSPPVTTPEGLAALAQT